MPPDLQAPFVYWGGKRKIAPLIWDILGDVPNYVEPFCGSCAILLARPGGPGRGELVNDIDANVVNCLRALKHDPGQLAHLCDYPVTEVDMNAWHFWLMEPTRRTAFVTHLLADPEYYDLVRAARWLHGINAFIGGGWCRDEGMWEYHHGSGSHLKSGIVKRTHIPHVSTLGTGIHKRMHIPQVGNLGRGIHKYSLREGQAQTMLQSMLDWFTALQERLRSVRMACGDWTRVVTPACITGLGLTGIVFDPPYSLEEDRDMRLYVHDDGAVAHAVRAWCLEHGDDPQLKIVMCGYGAIHDALVQAGWTKYQWVGHAGYGNTGDQTRGQTNRKREAVYASPHCVPRAQLTFF